MKKGNLPWSARLLMAVCGLSLIAVIFVPIWRIELNAPQYPEGLSLNIHANGIRGNVDIINGLNHYIGMKTLHNADFPEFTILPYCIAFFSLLFLLVALLRSTKLYYTAFFLFVAFGVIAMADFWKWEYNYGHNLDPHAAIVVPGMAYQPPLIGYKQLLNFAAYSVPDTGGWIFIGCGGLLLLGVVLERRNAGKLRLSRAALPVVAGATLLLNSCTSGPEAIKTGADMCDNCKMTIADPRFGAEILTSTGKAFKFDDIRCMQQYYDAMDAGRKQHAAIYLTDFCGDHRLLKASQCQLLKSDALKCPMDGHMAAFGNQDSLDRVKETYPGTKTDLTLLR